MPNYLVYKSGQSSVGQYQMSGIPFMTASVTVSALGSAPLEISFPRVSKFVTVRNMIPTSSADRTLRVGFSSIGTSGSVPGNNYYFTLANGESYTGDWRVTSVFLLCDTTNLTSASVIAGLTAISTSSLGFDNWSGSLGVG
jgi:hypothetical protein